jgi:hypothetical protein
MLSTSSATESLIKKPKIGLSTPEFRLNIPNRGGRVFVNNSLIKNVNTCTIDYFLFSLWLAWRLGPFEFEDNDNDLSKHLYEIIQHIENRDWDEAKFIWAKDVIKMNFNPMRDIDMWGTEMEIFVNFFSLLQEYTIIKTRSASCKSNNSQKKIVF